MSSESIDLSVVIPVYNEVESIPELHKRILEVMEKSNYKFEIIYCDDGSRDGSFEMARDWAEQDTRVKVISFRRNFGQTAALEAGFRNASGKIIIPMDADLQNDPADIPMLIEELGDEYDVVKGWRRKRKDPFFSRTLPSKIANWLISKATKVKLHDYGCTLAAYKKEIIHEIHLYGEMHRFIPAYAVWAGGKIKEIEVSHHQRRFGKTKYNLSRTFRVILDLLTVSFLIGYNSKPLYFFGKWGATFLFFGFLSFCWTAIKKIIWDYAIYTDPFFYTTIFLGLAAMQMILFGLLAELGIRTYYESQNKTAYVVRQTINLPKKDK
jgi:glycosyltransferase involved in cell wall biosynthesis